MAFGIFIEFRYQLIETPFGRGINVPKPLENYSCYQQTCIKHIVSIENFEMDVNARLSGATSPIRFRIDLLFGNVYS